MNNSNTEATIKAYEINLNGQGDTEVALVDEITFNWITCGKHTGRQGDECCWEDLDMPDEVKARWLACEDRDEEEEFFEVTSGSLDNDRALCATRIPMVIDGEKAHFYSNRGLRDFLKKHPEIEVVDDYQGYIY